MNGVQTRFKCKLDVKRCKRFVFPPSSLLPRSNALKTKAIRYFQTDRTLTRIVSPPLNAGEGVVQLVNTQKLRIKFTVPDDYLYLLRAKDVKFKVVFDSYPAEAFDARLEEYLDISTAGTGIPVTITIDDPHFDRTRYDVKPGFTCKIKLASDVAPFLEEKLMNVPLSAVFGDSENRKTYVWVVEGNKVSRREVTVYSPTGEANLLISKGLEPGETVVTAGVYQLTEGEAIKVLM